MREILRWLTEESISWMAPTTTDESPRKSDSYRHANPKFGWQPEMRIHEWLTARDANP